MKILVTGGAGFIGHNVVRQLEQLDHECLILDTHTDYGFVPSEENKYLIDHRLRRVKATCKLIDIRHPTYIESIIESFRPDVLIHMASFPRQKIVSKTPILASDVMSNGLLNLLEASKDRIEKFVYISSSMVYGDFENDVTEDSDCNPIGQYGIQKLAGEKLVKDYTRQEYFDNIIIRPSAVYGEWDVNDRVVSKFMTMAMRNEILKVHGQDEILDFTYVEDTANGIVLAATKDVKNTTYNITRSNDRTYTLHDAAKLANKIANPLGKIDLGPRDLDFPKRGRLDITKAIRELGYNPKVNVEEGFKKYHEWYLDNPKLWRDF